MRKPLLLLLLLLFFVGGCFENNPYTVPVNTTNVSSVINESVVNETIVVEGLSVLPALIPYPNNLTVYFFSVGRADSILVVAPDNRTLLIDGGNEGDGSNIVHILRNLGIEKLDLVVASHLHEDHIGGLNYIMLKIPADKVLRSGSVCDSQICNDFLNSIQGKEVLVGWDQLLDFGDLFVKVFVAYDDGQGFSGNENDNSILTKISYGSVSFLFAADCEESCEMRVEDADLSADFLKVAHHGSCTSSSLVFLREVMPEKAFVTLGTDDLVCGEVKERFKYLDIPVYGTGEGTIVVTTDGSNVGFGVKK